MTSCPDLSQLLVPDLESSSSPYGGARADGYEHDDQLERLVVELDARSGLINLERVVGLLRGRRHRVAGLTTDLRGERARVVVWGPDLHGDDPEALVVRRLLRLPGVLAARIVMAESAREDTEVTVLGRSGPGGGAPGPATMNAMRTLTGSQEGSSGAGEG